MYRNHFGLTRHPFAKDIAPEDLYGSAAARELEARLNHLIDLRGVGLITGESGSGKTTICRKVASALHSGSYRVFYVPNSTGNVMDLYKSISWEAGPAPSSARARRCTAPSAARSRGCVLESHVRPVARRRRGAPPAL
jgi:type II secretory pathway predicted ATPase ExeA